MYFNNKKEYEVAVHLISHKGSCFRGLQNLKQKNICKTQLCSLQNSCMIILIYDMEIVIIGKR